ncbi:MAG: helicase, partial [Muribaculaceae bacterium]|nr:helicase [Muribaculaceae bacterium]
EVQFFAKFVLCSNNELYPVIIDQEETRYWVRKVSHLESDDTFFLDKLKAEIPAFLFYLQHRHMSTGQQSRMWFSPKDIHTEALDKIIQNNRPRLEVDMAEVVLDIMDKQTIASVQFCLDDLMALLMFAHVKVEKSQVRKILKDYWKLSPAPNALTYTTYVNDCSFGTGYSSRTKVGRFFTVNRDTIRHLCP